MGRWRVRSAEGLWVPSRSFGPQPQTSESADPRPKLGPSFSWGCSHANHFPSLDPTQVLGSSLIQLGSELGQRCEEAAPLPMSKDQLGSVIMRGPRPGTFCGPEALGLA